MHTSAPMADRARELAATGHHAEIVQLLGTQEGTELESSPSLALLYGTAHTRLGRLDEGLRWLDVALAQAQKRDERAVERQALNARGAVAFASGRIDEAADFFTRGLMRASRDGDLETAARCSNNLGVISDLQGRHAEAIGSWQIALAAFERAGLRQGVAECRHNLGIVYREQGLFDQALAEADRAVAIAEAIGNRTLLAMALRSRAETRTARGEAEAASGDIERTKTIRRELRDPVGEAEDLRVEAGLLAAEGQTAAAEGLLRDAIVRAETHRRPQLLGEATRDLALLLRRAGRIADAQAAALTAQAVFARLGAEGEIRDLAAQAWDDAFASRLRGSLAPLHAAQELADTGRYVTLLTYLGERRQEEIEQSPVLALLCGIAHGRLGRLELGRQWAMAALARARAMGDRKLEVRALNVCGALALEGGGIVEATRFFGQAQEEAMREHDMATVGRGANNLGVIANMQGDYGPAVGAYTRAIAAYQQAGYDRGIAEAQHNLAITYREQGRLDDALQAADTAVRDAERLGDEQFHAQALAGRAEILTARGEPRLAVREAERAVTVHRKLKDGVRETEDLRILAVALGDVGQTAEAANTLRDVIARATEHGRPLLVATAQRDLARLLARHGDAAAAREAARAARETFVRLGAKAEVEKIDALFKGRDAPPPRRPPEREHTARP